MDNSTTLRICGSHVCVGEATAFADLRVGSCVVSRYCSVWMRRRKKDEEGRKERRKEAAEDVGGCSAVEWSKVVQV